MDGVFLRCVAGLLACAPLGCVVDPNGDGSRGSTGEAFAASSSTATSMTPETGSTTGLDSATEGDAEPDETTTGSGSSTEASSNTTMSDSSATGGASTGSASTGDASAESTSTGATIDPPSCDPPDASTPDCTPWVFTPDPAWTLGTMHARPSGGLSLGGWTSDGALLVGLDPQGVVEWTHIFDPTEHGFAAGAASVGGLATLASGDLVALIDRDDQPAILVRLEPSDGTLAWAHELDDAFFGLPWGVAGDLYEPPTVSSDARVAASMTSSALVVSVSGSGGYPPGPPPRLIVRLDPATGLPLWVQPHGAYNGGLSIDDVHGRVLSQHQQSTGFTVSHIAAHHLDDGALETTLNSALLGGGLGLSDVGVRSDGSLVGAFYLDFAFQPTHLGVWDEMLELEDAHVLPGVFPLSIAVDALDVAHILLGASSPCDPLLVRVPPGGQPEVELLRGEDWPGTRSLSIDGTAIRLLHIGGEVRQVCLPA